MTINELPLYLSDEVMRVVLCIGIATGLFAVLWTLHQLFTLLEEAKKTEKLVRISTPDGCTVEVPFEIIDRQHCQCSSSTPTSQTFNTHKRGRFTA
jgi:cobalamin biosynthesis protein CbiD